MKIEIMIAVLALLCIGSLAAAFVLWAKADEYKRMAQDEHANYLAALDLHNTTADAAQRVSDELDLKKCLAEHDLDYALRVSMENIELQDHLSALLCPMNDHVWKDGRCVKCGRMQDAEIH